MKKCNDAEGRNEKNEKEKEEGLNWRMEAWIGGENEKDGRKDLEQRKDKRYRSFPYFIFFFGSEITKKKKVWKGILGK